MCANLYLSQHSRNVLVHDGHIKLTDFGVSRHVDIITTIHKGVFGRVPYMEPKLFRNIDYHVDKRSDCYSLGVLLWEISTGRRPFAGCDEILTKLAIIDGERETPSPDTPQKYVDLYKKCWDGEPENRPSASDAYTCLVKMKETGASSIQNDNGKHLEIIISSNPYSFIIFTFQKNQTKKMIIPPLVNIGHMVSVFVCHI